LAAGNADITFGGKVGNTRLGKLNVTSARNVTANDSITAASISQMRVRVLLPSGRTRYKYGGWHQSNRQYF
jgi:hypothetical protein